MKPVSYEKAKELRDWSTWLFTIAIVPVLGVMVWFGRNWLELHDLKVADSIQATYTTKAEANVIAATAKADATTIATATTARETGLQNQIVALGVKVDTVTLGVAKIQQTLDDEKDNETKDKQ